MYIPKHQYEVVNVLDGTHAELFFEDGTPFSGSSFVRLSNGLKFQVPSDDLAKGIFDKAKKIVSPEDNINPKSILNFLKRFVPKRPSGTSKISRYFMKNKVDGKIAEIDRESFSRLNDGEASHVVVAELTWYIAGPLYDFTSNNMTLEGTVNKNSKELDILERKFPGIKSYVTDLTFLSDPQYANQTPQVISNPNIVLPSPS
jgi:hypothetical protein